MNVRDFCVFSTITAVLNVITFTQSQTSVHAVNEMIIMLANIELETIKLGLLD